MIGVMPQFLQHIGKFYVRTRHLNRPNSRPDLGLERDRLSGIVIKNGVKSRAIGL